MSKHKIPFLISILTILVFGSCSKQEATQKESKPDETETLNEKDPLVLTILKAGFKMKDIVAYKDRYVVEGDIMFFKKDYPEPSREAQTEQTQSHYIVSNDYRSNVRVFLNTANFSGINLSTPLDNVIAAFNAAGSTIQFTRVFTAGAADIEILRYDNLGSTTCGQASTYPLPNGTPGRYVYISEQVLVNNAITDPSQLTFLLAHEIGHCIGFRHTNWQQNGEGAGGVDAGAINIPGTPTTDANSVMNANTCGLFWNGFSSFDNMALNTLYNNNTTFVHQLKTNMQLKQNESLLSLDGRFRLTLQPDGNLVLFMFNSVLWASNTCCDANNVRLIMQADGNLVLFRANNTARWATATDGYHNGELRLQDDGNLVITQNGFVRWASGTCCH